MFCPKCRMANADTRQTCSKCGVKLALVPGAVERASVDKKAEKLADEWGSGLKLTAPVQAAAVESGASDSSSAVAADLSANALSLGISPDPILVSAQKVVAPAEVRAAEPTAPTSRSAKLSFFLGLFSVIPPVAVYAIRYGYRGRAEARESQGRVKGRRLATAGLVLGWIGVVAFTCLFAWVISSAARFDFWTGGAEPNAVAKLRTFNQALITYAATYQNGFPSTVNPLTNPRKAEMKGCNHAGLISLSLVDTENGYAIRYTPLYPDSRNLPAISPKAAAANCVSGGASGYALHADPVNAKGRSGSFRHFYSDQTGIIRYSTGDTPADENSPSLQ